MHCFRSTLLLLYIGLEYAIMLIETVPRSYNHSHSLYIAGKAKRISTKKAKKTKRSSSKGAKAKTKVSEEESTGAAPATAGSVLNTSLIHPSPFNDLELHFLQTTAIEAGASDEQTLRDRLETLVTCPSCSALTRIMTTCFVRIVDRLERSGVDLDGDGESTVGGGEG